LIMCPAAREHHAQKRQRAWQIVQHVSNVAPPAAQD
jgi:hypothetical protein